MLCNIINKIFNRNRICDDIEIDYENAKELLIKYKENCILLDVRSPQEYKEYHLEGSINIPLYDVVRKVNNIIKSKEDTIIIIYCQTGHRSKKAIGILKRLGYKNLYIIKGGLDMLH